ncbi:hypothetical protein P9272_33645 [Mesorhizobium sp. WSM4976]|uniref:hypothetical protein n=1 Tax=Mesorhizobium sp. WSM4976 TaxID=3038549 RepID=UPI00241620B6|nr:hypothetical protein [Mesorhizobium sp. WSM4976]MDG4898473.1 hypothetical protein [Mesorhizobium sp. WSM4976]
MARDGSGIEELSGFIRSLQEQRTPYISPKRLLRETIGSGEPSFQLAVHGGVDAQSDRNR